jgi:hypothetical protein
MIRERESSNYYRPRMTQAGNPYGILDNADFQFFLIAASTPNEAAAARAMSYRGSVDVRSSAGSAIDEGGRQGLCSTQPARDERRGRHGCQAQNPRVARTAGRCSSGWDPRISEDRGSTARALSSSLSRSRLCTSGCSSTATIMLPSVSQTVSTPAGNDITGEFVVGALCRIGVSQRS